MIDFAQVEAYRENNRIEAKKALGGLPESIWETYSAFANTMGGIILLGVEEKRDGSFHAIDLPDPDWLIADFWDIINDKSKISANILKPQNVSVESVDGKRIIAIRIPEALKSERPVYLGASPFTGAYVRRGEGDCRCSRDEVASMIKEAARETSEATQNAKKSIVIFLTEFLFASAREIAALLCICNEEAERLLLEMISDGIIEKTVINGCIRYRLKA